MRLIKTPDGRFIFFCTYDERRNAFGFTWNKAEKYWHTANPAIAIKCAAYASDELREELLAAARNAPDPDKATLRLENGVWRWYGPIRLNLHPKTAGFRATDKPFWHWWTEDVSKAVRCYQSASESIPDEFVCDGEAQAILIAENSKAINSIVASKAADADISLPVPPGCVLLPYQRAGVAYAKDKDRVLIGDQMRLGKTPQSIVWLNCDPSLRSGLIIVPATIKLNWLREWKKWSTLGLTVGVAWGFDAWPKADVVIVNAEILYRQKDAYKEPVLLKGGKPKMKGGKPVVRKVYPLRKEIKDRAWDFVIADECHRFKSEDTARYQALTQLQPRKRAGLTGTPIPNRPIEIFPILHWLDPTIFPDRWKFAMRYAGATKGPFGWDVSGASHLDELQRILRQNIMVRRLRSEVLKELPPKRRQLIEFPCPDNRFVNEQDALWKRYTDLSTVIREAVADSDVTAEHEEYKEQVRGLESERMACFEEMSRIRHEDAVKRIPFVVAHLKELLEDEPKAICFAWHNNVVESIAAEFDASNTIVIYGKTPQNQRVILQDRFNSDPNCKLCVISIAVCEGLDLSAASLGVMAEHDWVPKNIAQAEDRMENPFKKDSSLIQYLVFQDSLDARMAQTLVYKEEIGYDALDREITGLAELSAVATPETAEIQLPEKLEASDPVRVELPGLGSVAVKSSVSAGPELSAGDCEVIHSAVRQLAGVCDGAFSRDSVGFSAMDVRIGHSLAIQPKLSPAAAKLALSVLKKYQYTQLNGQLERFYK